jgi:hypothetical protein
VVVMDVYYVFAKKKMDVYYVLLVLIDGRAFD